MKRSEHSKLMTGKGNPNYCGGKLTVVCENCGRSFQRYKSLIEGRIFCGNECKWKYFQPKMSESEMYDLYFK